MAEDGKSHKKLGSQISETNFVEQRTVHIIESYLKMKCLVATLKNQEEYIEM